MCWSGRARCTLGRRALLGRRCAVARAVVGHGAWQDLLTSRLANLACSAATKAACSAPAAPRARRARCSNSKPAVARLAAYLTGWVLQRRSASADRRCRHFGRRCSEMDEFVSSVRFK